MKILCFLSVMLVLCVSPLLNAQEKKSIGILPFEAVGNVPQDAGKELAGFVSGILGEKYVVKERFQTTALVREMLFQQGKIVDDKALEDQKKALGVDLLLLGQISKTSSEYSLFIRICDLSGKMGSFRDTIEASTWEGLKEKLRLSLIQHKLVEIAFKEARPVSINFVVLDEAGQSQRANLVLLKDDQRLVVRDSMELVPGKYRVETLDKSFWSLSKQEPENTWIEVKSGDNPETFQIRLKYKGVDILVVLSYGGLLGTILGILYFCIRKLRRPANIPSAGASWSECVDMAKSMRGRCDLLSRDTVFQPKILELKRSLDLVVSKVEAMPVRKQQERLYHWKKELESIQNELSELKGMATGSDKEAIARKIEEILRRASSLS